MSNDNSGAPGAAAFVFPGVAVEPSGAEAAFFDKHRGVMAPFIAQASEAAGVDLAEVCGHGGLAGLDERNSQLFTVAYSHGVAMVHVDAGIVPAVLAGYSLGVYAALSASGAVAFGDCLALAALAYDLMRRECGGAAYAMGAVVGLTEEETRGMLASGAFPTVRRTNTNNATCGVYSGAAPDIAGFFDAARSRGALSTVTFDVSIPYHHADFLGGAAQRFLDAVNKVAWRDSPVPVVSSIDQRSLVKAADLAGFAAQNIASPVNWQKVAETIAAMGVTTAYECGPGISLCQNGRFIEPRLRYVTVRKLVRRESP